MIIDIYKNSIAYPLKDSKTFLYFSLTIFSNFILWMVYLTAFFGLQIDASIKLISLIIPIILTVIINFLFLGYEYKVLQNSANDTVNEAYEVPKFDNFKEMIKNGAKIFAVKIIYFIVPAIIFAITNLGLVNSISGGVIGTIGSVIAILLAIILYFVSFISITHMATHNNFKKAFDFKEIKEVILKIGPARYVLFYIGLIIIATIIFCILFSIVLTLTIISEIMFMGTTWYALFIIANILMSLVVALAELFKTRGIGLIYEPIEK